MEDFFRELEECLRGEVSEGEIRDSINYYRQYFAEHYPNFSLEHA